MSSGRRIMKKLGMLGIIGGAALLTVAPVSLQWSQDEVSLSLNSVNARTGRPLTATSIACVHRRVYRRTYRRAAVLELLQARKRAYCLLALSPIPLQLLSATLCERKLLRRIST